MYEENIIRVLQGRNCIWSNTAVCCDMFRYWTQSVTKVCEWLQQHQTNLILIFIQKVGPQIRVEKSPDFAQETRWWLVYT